MVTSLDKKYMHTCLSLALKGKGKVAPNPMVGCVVLDKNGKVVSKGYHKKYGQNLATGRCNFLHQNIMPMYSDG